MSLREALILPKPVSITMNPGVLSVAALDLSAQEPFYPVLGALREDLCESFGESVVYPGSAREQFAFFSANDPAETRLWGANFREEAGRIAGLRLSCSIDLCPGAYRLEVSQGTISLEAFDLEGMASAAASLMQILLQTWDGWRWQLSPLVIEDRPALAWRGLMLDSSRHFIPLPVLKRMVRLASIWKINRLHWHLSDDQGWRVALDGLRDLSVHGSTRKGADPHKDGLYSKEDIRSLVAYAAARGVSIMPELDLPGHVRAILAARPDLGCGEGPFEVWNSWGIADDVLCMGLDEALELAKAAWAELLELFPSPWVHIGGDECPTTRWEACPRCAARKEALGLEKWEDLQGWFIRELSSFLRERGKTVFGWDEVLDSAVSQAAGPVNVFHWRAWLPEQGQKALEKGLSLVRSPFFPCYLDFVQTDDRSQSPGLAYRSPKAATLESLWSFDPCEGIKVPAAVGPVAGQPASGQPASGQPVSGQPAGFLGIQANVWTEYIRDGKRLEYMVFPRLIALAERAWRGSDAGTWEDFSERLRDQGILLQRLGINHGPLPKED